MIHNISKQTVISADTIYAENFFDRSRGMICRDFSTFDGMVFENCRAIHTFFMTIKLDVIFVDDSYQICGLYESLPAWLPLIRNSKSTTVIELPVGVIKRSKCSIGDIVNIKTEIFDKTHEQILANKVLVNTETIIPFTEKPQ